MIVAVDGVLITRGQFQVSAILRSLEAGSEASFIIRRKGATSDGTTLDKVEPSETDPEPQPGAEGSGSGCCVLL